MIFSDYEDLYFTLLNLTAGPGDEVQFTSLSEYVRALYIAAVFDMEIQNGGLCQFFVNCGSSYAAKVTESFQALGLEPMAGNYESFLSKYQIDPMDLSSFRCDTINDFDILCARYPFNEFDDAYINLWNELDFADTMLRYADAHPEAF